MAYKIGDVIHADLLASIPPGSVVKDPEGHYRVTADPERNDWFIFTDRGGWDEEYGENFEIVALAPTDRESAEKQWVAKELWHRRNLTVQLFGEDGSEWDNATPEHRYVYLRLAEWVLSNFVRRTKP